MCLDLDVQEPVVVVQKPGDGCQGSAHKQAVVPDQACKAMHQAGFCE